MKTIKIILLLATFGLLLSCDSEQEDIMPSFGKGTVSLKSNGVLWQSNATLDKRIISSDNPERYVLSINAPRNEQESVSILFNWFEDEPNMAYQISLIDELQNDKNENASIAYILVPNTEVYYGVKNPERLDEVRITRFDGIKLEGTFSFRAVNTNNNTEVREMTEGTFSFDLN
jgi:hypothetical protein